MPRPRPSAAALAAALCALVALFGVLKQWRPFLTTKADVITATPSLAGIFQRNVIAVKRGREACVSPVTFSPKTARVQLLLVAAKGAGPATITASAPGYASRARATGFGTGVDVPYRATIASPPKTVTGKLCITNDGRRQIGLVGTAEGRSNAPAVTTIDGKTQPADAALTLLTAKPDSIAGRFGTVLGHASDMTGGLIPTFLLWLAAFGLLVLTVVGLPFALWQAVREGP